MHSIAVRGPLFLQAGSKTGGWAASPLLARSKLNRRYAFTGAKGSPPRYGFANETASSVGLRQNSFALLR